MNAQKAKLDQIIQTYQQREAPILQRTRKNVRENLSYALQLGFQEIAQEHNSDQTSSMLKNLDVESCEFSDLEKMSDLSLILATKIESCLFVEMNDEISKAYGTKFRDLLAALKNDENTHLRVGLLIGDIKPADFVRYTKE